MTITYVGAGAAATGNNASVAPALHASTAAGDLVLVLASIRGTAATVTTPTGYTRLGGTENVALFGKLAGSSESAPTVAFAGGSAGDDTIAQAATFRGIEPYLGGIAFNIQTNTSAANVAYPALTVGEDGHAVIVAGWKQDDSTGWAAIASYTEIGESNPTAGNDASMAWDYRIETTAASLGAGSFTVTGGASAVSKGLTALIRPAAAITAVEQDTYPPRVLVSVTGLTLGDDITVYRVVDTARTALRAGTGTDILDPSFLVVDAELPFGVAVSYVAVVNGGAEYTTSPATHTLPGLKVALSDAVGGSSAEVVVLSWPDKVRDTNSTTFRAGSRNIVVAGPVGQWKSTIELFVETSAAADQLRTLIGEATSNIMQIRQAGGYDDVDSYVAVTTVTERRWSQDGSDQRRRFVLEVAEVDAWPATQEARGFTLQDLADAYTGLTLADVNADYLTLLALALADLS